VHAWLEAQKNEILFTLFTLPVVACLAGFSFETFAKRNFFSIFANPERSSFFLYISELTDNEISFIFEDWKPQTMAATAATYGKKSFRKRRARRNGKKLILGKAMPF
jgi:hypothetical protein